MKSTAVCCIVLLCYACSPKIQSATQPLLGKVTRESMQQSNDWFTKNYNEYTVDTVTALQLKKALKTKKLYLFMGTWCGDRKREVPRIYKILDCCGFKRSQIQLIAVSNDKTMYKQSPTHEEKGLDIIRVPTLLIVAHNNETGRIVETPVVSWEKDLLAILTRQPYQPHYSNGPYKTRAVSIH